MQIRWCSTYRFFFHPPSSSVFFSFLQLRKFTQLSACGDIITLTQGCQRDLCISDKLYWKCVSLQQSPPPPLHFFFPLISTIPFSGWAKFCLCLCLVGAFQRKLSRVISISALCFCLCISMCACWYGRGCVQMNSLIRRDAQKLLQCWWVPASVLNLCLEFVLGRLKQSRFLTFRWLSKAKCFSWLRSLTHIYQSYIIMRSCPGLVLPDLVSHHCHLSSFKISAFKIK